MACASRTPVHPPIADAPPPEREAASPRAVAFDRETVSRLNRMASWLILLQPDSAEAPVFEAHGLALSGEEYEAALELFLDGRPPSPEEEAAFRARLEEKALLLRLFEEGGLSGEASFALRARQAIHEVLADQILETLAARDPIQPEEVQALYAERRDSDYALPARARVRIIQVETEEEAEELRALLEEEQAEFRTLAQDRSIHESRADGGELPEFTRGTYAEGFEDTVFGMEPGGLALHSGASGIFLIEKMTHIAASYVPLDQVRADLLGELERQRRAEILRKLRQELTPE